MIVKFNTIMKEKIEKILQLGEFNSEFDDKLYNILEKNNNLFEVRVSKLIDKQKLTLEEIYNNKLSELEAINEKYDYDLFKIYQSTEPSKSLKLINNR